MKHLVSTLTMIIDKKKRETRGTRDEFRFNIDARHYNYIFEVHETDDEYYALGITTEPETFGKGNIPLKHNPQKGKTQPSFIRNGEIVAGHKAFGRKVEKNIKFHSDDIPNVKAKKRNAKKNIKAEKKNKKKK